MELKNVLITYQVERPAVQKGASVKLIGAGLTETGHGNIVLNTTKITAGFCQSAIELIKSQLSGKGMPVQSVVILSMFELEAEETDDEDVHRG
jgi:hypothetical protein